MNHILRKSQVSYILSSHLTPILLWYSFIPLIFWNANLLASEHHYVNISSLNVVKSPKSCLPFLILCRRHLLLFLGSLILNLIQSCLATHLRDHPHLYDHQSSNMVFLNQPTSYNMYVSLMTIQQIFPFRFARSCLSHTTPDAFFHFFQHIFIWWFAYTLISLCLV